MVLFTDRQMKGVCSVNVLSKVSRLRSSRTIVKAALVSA